jgi:signal transduction histidine kinase
MTTLINELLESVRLQQGQAGPLERRPTDLVALAVQVAEACQQTTERHHITVAARAPALVGEWDADQLERVLSNLITNAIKYSPAGGTIGVMVEPADDAPAGWAVMAVQDQGLGIPAADVTRIFEPFQRAGNVGEWIGGTGLGLASARKIVEQHGGTITVESQEGVGSTFTVRLPLTTAGA